MGIRLVAALLPIALGDDHFNDLAVPRDEVDEQLRGLIVQFTQSGLVASTNRAIMPASIGTVFARRPSAWRSGALAPD